MQSKRLLSTSWIFLSSYITGQENLGNPDVSSQKLVGYLILGGPITCHNDSGVP